MQKPTDIILVDADAESGRAYVTSGSPPNDRVVPVHRWPLALAAEPEQAARLIGQAVDIVNATQAPARRIVCRESDLVEWEPYCIHPGADVVPPQDGAGGAGA